MLLKEAKQILMKNGYKMNESATRTISTFDIGMEDIDDLEDYLYNHFGDMFPDHDIETYEGSTDSSIIVAVLGRPLSVDEVIEVFNEFDNDVILKFAINSEN